MSNSKASQPFPSPGSAFIPPPVPRPHEFALPRRMSKKDVDDPTPSTINGVVALNGVVSHTRANFIGFFVPRFIISVLNIPRSLWHMRPFQDPLPLALPAPPTPTPLPLSADPPDPQLFLPSSSNHRLSTQSVTSLTSSRPAPPSPAVSRRASGLSRASSRPVSGMNSTPSSRPASATAQSTTPTPATSTFSRHPPDRLSSSLPSTDVDTTAVEMTSTPTQATPTAVPTLIQIRDYGFSPTDPRFTGQGPHVPRPNRPAFLARRLASSSTNGFGEDDDGYDDEDEVSREYMSAGLPQNMWDDADDGINGFGGFKWGLGRAWGSPRGSGAAGYVSSLGFPSRGDLDRNFGGEDEWEDMEIDDEGETFSEYEGEGDTEGEPPLLPGLYRALYAFEPEGIAEMKLDEDQLVRVIGRGGGVGWAVVVKGGLKDAGVHALVPESYLEPLRLDGEEDA